MKSKIWRRCIKKFHFANEFVYKNQEKVRRKKEMNKFSGGNKEEIKSVKTENTRKHDGLK